MECVALSSPYEFPMQRSRAGPPHLCCTRLAHPASMPPMKYWEIVADKLSAARLPIFIGKAAQIAAGRGAVAAQ